MKRLNVILLLYFLTACAGVPENIQPITGFDLDKYAGKWYEIARLDHPFESGLEQVTATYTVNNDGSVRVENRGFSTKNNEWKNAVGKAKFAGDSNIGYLKVSFFGPFYGSYVIFDLDKEHYQYSFVTSGENTLWLLSRTPKISEELKGQFLGIVQDAGYDIQGLIFVNQE